MKPSDVELRNQQRESAELPLFEQSFAKFEQQATSGARVLADPAENRVPRESKLESRVANSLSPDVAHARLPLFDFASTAEPTASRSSGLEGASAVRPSGRAVSVAGEPARLRVSGPHNSEAHARRDDPATSKAAAKSVVNLGRTRDAILRILRTIGPATDEQIQDKYAQWKRGEGLSPVSPSGLRSRRAELVMLGFVEAAGTGKTAAKRDCTIWRLRK